MARGMRLTTLLAVTMHVRGGGTERTRQAGQATAPSPGPCNHVSRSRSGSAFAASKPDESPAARHLPQCKSAHAPLLNVTD